MERPTVEKSQTLPAPTRAIFEVAGIQAAENVARDEKRGAEDVEPEHHAGESAKFVGEVDGDFAEPLLRDGGVMVCGVREDVVHGDGVGGPDDLAHLEMPPHVGIVKALVDGYAGEHDEQEGKHNGKRKDAAHGLKECAGTGRLGLDHRGRVGDGLQGMDSPLLYFGLRWAFQQCIS